MSTNRDALLLFDQDEPAQETVNNNINNTSININNNVSLGAKQSKAHTSTPGNTTTSPGNNSNNNMNTAGALGDENRNMDLNTLDEPVVDTIKRDLLSIWAKVKQVFFPASSSSNNGSTLPLSAADASQHHILRDWDLWGPLLLCLILSIRLSITAPDGQAPKVFTTIFAIVWMGAAIVTVNTKLLGGKLSFFQSVCVLGYCLFPLAVGSIITLFVPFVVRVVVVIVGLVWATWSSVGFIGEAKLNDRRLLAIYPISLFYFAIAWIILVSKSL